MRLFEALRAVPGHLPALVGGPEVVDYHALRAQASGLADAITTAGVGPGDRVALWVPRGPDAPVTLLAVWAAGAVAVPLDPLLPLPRLRILLERSESKILVACGPRGRSLGRQIGDPWADRLITQWEPSSEDGLSGGVTSGQAASILYTSGSTGPPKGVTITHEHVEAFTGHWANRVGLAPGAVVAALTSLSFDLSLFDIGATLRSGAALWCAPAGLLAFPVRLAAELGRVGTTHLYTVPSLLVALHDVGLPAFAPSLRMAMYAGEAMAAPDAARLRRSFPRLLNLFGPTETNVSCAYELPQDWEGDQVPVGWPCEYLEILLIDEEGRAAEEGEIVARGATVTPGYWGEPDRASWWDGGGGRWLRTGDRARRGSDGSLTFLGRRDRMVKLRGYRVEPEEVERALRAVEGVAEAAVLPVTGPEPSGAVSLVAFVAPEYLDPAVLAEALRLRLAPWALPDRIEVLPSLPRTDRGKVDLQALSCSVRGAAR